MNRQEPKIENQKAGSRKSSKRFRIDAGLSLNDWHEVNLNSIKGVCVDDSFGISISSS